MSATCLLCTFFPTGKRGCMWSVEEFAMQQLHGYASALCSKTCSVATLYAQCSSTKHVSTFPPGSTGHHAKVLNAWMRFMRAASGSHSGWLVWLLQAVRIFCLYRCEGEGCNAAYFHQESVRTARLCGEAARAATAQTAISAYLLRSADGCTLAITTLGLIVTAASNQLSMPANLSARQSPLNWGCWEGSCWIKDFKLPLPQICLQNKSRGLSRSDTPVHVSHCLPFLY